MLEKICVGIYNLMNSILLMFGYQIRVRLGEHKIKIDWVKPKDRNDIAWDNSHYVYGNVFLKGHANPIKPTKKGNDIELISSKRYKKFMQMNTFEQIAKLSSGNFMSGVEKLLKLLLILIGFNATVLIIWLLGYLGVF